MFTITIAILSIITILPIILKKSYIKVVFIIYLFFFFLTSIYGLKELSTISFFPQDLSKLFSFYELLMEKVDKKYKLFRLSMNTEGERLFIYLNILISFLALYIIVYKVFFKVLKKLKTIQTLDSIYDYSFCVFLLSLCIPLTYILCLVFVIYNENLITYFFDVLEKEHNLSLSQDVLKNSLRPILSTKIEELKEILNVKKEVFWEIAYEEKKIREHLNYTSYWEMSILNPLVDDISIFSFLEGYLQAHQRKSITLWNDAFQGLKVQISTEHYSWWKKIEETFLHVVIEEDGYILLTPDNISFIIRILDGREYHLFYNQLVDRNLLQDFINSTYSYEKSAEEMAPPKHFRQVFKNLIIKGSKYTFFMSLKLGWKLYNCYWAAAGILCIALVICDRYYIFVY